MPSRFIVIHRKQAGRTVVELLRSHFHLTPADVRTLLKNKGITLGGVHCWDLTRRVRSGQKLRIESETRLPTAKDPAAGTGRKGRQERPALSSRKTSADKTKPIRKAAPTGEGDSAQKIPIVYIDKDVVVVDKPAGLTTVRHASELAEHGGRAQRFLPATLLDLVTAQLSQGRLRAVHRLDKDTSGLVVLARTAAAERAFGLQFRGHAVERTYLALVRGRAETRTITSRLVRDRGDGRRGSAAADSGQPATTHVKVVEELPGYTLIECRLETGRTHQVRIHLGENGTPLCGEKIYDRPLGGKPWPDASGADRPALHAATLAFAHPVSGKQLSFASPLPADMKRLLKRLRHEASG